MSKELEALKNIHNSWNCCNPNSYGCDERDFEIIETALKDYKTLEEDFNKHYERSYKKLKALEIIRKKMVDMAMFNCCDFLTQYNDWARKYLTLLPPEKRKLTQAEFDLLKEVLL